MQKLKQYQKTAKYQLTFYFVRILCVILLVSNVVFIVGASLFSYEYIANRTQKIISSLKNDNHPKENWRYVVDAYVSADDEDALKITLRSGNVYYSNNASSVFEQVRTGQKSKLLPGIVFSQDDIYYTKHVDLKNFSVDIALDTEELLELTVGLLKINLFLNILALFIGAILIYWRVIKWSQKLTTMANETKNLTKEKLSVPSDPIEISEVANAFNELLAKKQQLLIREQQFVADASHDLKTPITAIRGHVNLILRRGKNHPEIIFDSLTFIDQESKRLQNLTKRLLLLSKAPLNLDVVLVDVSEIIQTTVKRLGDLNNSQIKLNLTLASNLCANQKDLELIVQNLIENALKYAPGLIEINLVKQNDVLVLQVCDHGSGIPKAEQQKVFERFYRLEKTRFSHESCGLGLAIVKELVEKYQGEIIVKETLGGGCTFEISWPVKIKKSSS